MNKLKRVKLESDAVFYMPKAQSERSPSRGLRVVVPMDVVDLDASFCLQKVALFTSFVRFMRMFFSADIIVLTY